jgi:hypothetical protein
MIGSENVDGQTSVQTMTGDDPSHSNSLTVLAARIQKEHKASTRAVRRGLTHAIRAGELLLEAKAQIKQQYGHGHWLPWLKKSCAIPERIVRHYMRLARNKAEIGNVADLTVREVVKKQAGNSTARGEDHFRVDYSVDYSLDQLVGYVPGWTGAMVSTQVEVDSAIEKLRKDGASGHWLAVAPRERLVIDHSVIGWLLITTPPLPDKAECDWVFDLLITAHKNNCPVWMSYRLIGKSHSQSPGMFLPRQVPRLNCKSGPQ